MKRKSAWIGIGLGALLICAILVGAQFIAPSGRPESDRPEGVMNHAPTPVNADSFVNPRALTAAFASVPTSTEPCAEYRGGVVNHHVLASDLLARFFTELARCRSDVTRVIILSPDHYQQSRTAFATFPDGYRVQGEVVSADQSAIDRLLQNPNMSEDARLFQNEHGIAALIPFMHQVYPKVTVVPMVVRERLSLKEADSMVETFRPLIDQHTVLIVSSDMSHYLSESTALQNDQDTKRAFQHNDQDFFWKATDDFTDNGKSIWIAQRVLSNTTWTLKRPTHVHLLIHRILGKH